MAPDLEPLAEKLVSKENLTMADFEAVFAAIREARADGRISLREMLAIAQQVWVLINEFIAQPQTGDGFGFEKQ